MCLQFGFLIFWQKDFGAKAAHKMLVKLKPGCDESIAVFVELSEGVTEGGNLGQIL
jgi:hypothetical protein